MKRIHVIAIGSLFLLSFISTGSGTGIATGEKAANKAVSIEIIGSASAKELSGDQAGNGRTFFTAETEWTNIHPKQKVEKDKLEGKTDRTMGVSALAGKKKKDTEYVEADVAYKIGKIFDHVYFLADGLAYPLHQITENIPDGAELQKEFTLTKQGETRKANFACLIPENAGNIAFLFFDYQYGHILIPIKGDLAKATGTGEPPGKVLDRISSPLVEIAVHAYDSMKVYQQKEAPEGWEFTAVRISGKSLSGKNIKDIVQLEPTEFTWVTGQGGYLYYAVGGTTTDQGWIRFTPEYYQSQELVFLVPRSMPLANLGIRLRNDVFLLKLTAGETKGMSEPLETHHDGDVMDVQLFGIRDENGKIIVDLGIQSLAASGIEIQRSAQFQLVVNDKKISLDESSTDSLFHRPPDPFVIPPKTFIRFELAFDTT